MNHPGVSAAYKKQYICVCVYSIYRDNMKLIYNPFTLLHSVGSASHILLSIPIWKRQFHRSQLGINYCWYHLFFWQDSTAPSRPVNTTALHLRPVTSKVTWLWIHGKPPDKYFRCQYGYWWFSLRASLTSVTLRWSNVFLCLSLRWSLLFVCPTAEFDFLQMAMITTLSVKSGTWRLRCPPWWFPVLLWTVNAFHAFRFYILDFLSMKTVCRIMRLY